MEAEHPPCGGIGVEPVGEERFDTRALVPKRERQDRHLQPRQGFAGIGEGLGLHPAQGGPHLLGLHHPHQLLAQEQAVIGFAAAGGEFPQGHPGPCTQIHAAAVLHRPAGGFQ